MFETLGAGSIRKDDPSWFGPCARGNGWAMYGNQYEFEAAVENHWAFQVEADEFARLFNTDQYQQVDPALANESPFARACHAVCTAPLQLQRVVR